LGWVRVAAVEHGLRRSPTVAPGFKEQQAVALPQLGRGQRANQMVPKDGGCPVKDRGGSGPRGAKRKAERGQGAEPKHHHATFGQGG
jgi:hypothetical protein